MSGIKFNQQTIQTIALFEKKTGAKLKDCFEDSNGTLIFIVEPGNMSQALGKNASNIPKFRASFNKNIRLIEYSDDLAQFVKNVARPVKLVAVRCEESIVYMQSPDYPSRGLLIGRNATTLRNNEQIVQRYFAHVKELKVEKESNEKIKQEV